jgi:hypothetical protein
MDIGAVMGMDGSPRRVTMLMKAPAIRPSTWTTTFPAPAGWRRRSDSYESPLLVSKRTVAVLAGHGDAHIWIDGAGLRSYVVGGHRPSFVVVLVAHWSDKSRVWALGVTSVRFRRYR